MSDNEGVVVGHNAGAISTTIVARTSDAWWKSAVVYQIYPRSFSDSNGDGIGDLLGVIDRVDYLVDLGIDVVWLSPVFLSPQADNGYDISDYQQIDPVFGTMADLAELIRALHSRGIKLMMDMVINHTSDEHPWFVESRRDRHGDKADWYIWRGPKPGHQAGDAGAEPNNWGSFFSGSAWEYEPERQQYYLHLFSGKQPDLNWDNPEVRYAIYEMMTWWLDRGVDGFRMDVINFISKDPAIPDGELTITGYGDGMPYFAYGPHIHDYLREMQAIVFAPRQHAYLTVGEMPGVTVEQALRFTDRNTGQLNMVFQFEHMELDHRGSKWNYQPATILDLKKSLGRWQEGMGDAGWNSLYWNNHDQPRVVSRFGNDTRFWYESATALATVLHLHRGTPYIYQGEEIGMTNVPFTDISDFRDIETLNAYAAAQGRGDVDLDQLLHAFRKKSRDNARTPVQWNSTSQAGFTTGTPWIPVNPAFRQINADLQRSDPTSIYAYYRKLIALRHDDDLVVEGDFSILLPDNPEIYAFTRSLPDSALLVIANLSDNPVTVQLDGVDPEGANLILSNHDHAAALSREISLRPWNARVYRWETLN